MFSYLVTGGGRGLGLELVRQLSRLPEAQVSVVFAATRSGPSTALRELIDGSNGRVVSVEMIITDQDSLKAGAGKVEKILGGKGLDVLINVSPPWSAKDCPFLGIFVPLPPSIMVHTNEDPQNAGIMPFALDGIAAMDNLGEGFKVNVEAVHYTTSTFLPLLSRGQQKKVFNM